jgi:hypothetical protein
MIKEDWKIIYYGQEDKKKNLSAKKERKAWSEKSLERVIVSTKQDKKKIYERNPLELC